MIDAMAGIIENQMGKRVKTHLRSAQKLPHLKTPKNRLSVDIDKMLVTASLVERVMPKALPTQHRSNWPIEMIVESVNTAYGYTEAGSRYQPKPEDVTVWMRVHDLLGAMQAEGGQALKWRAAIIGRYRMQSGIRLELELMPWRDLSSWLELKHDLKANKDTASIWVKRGIEWMVARS
jgi:hypothetical protein